MNTGDPIDGGPVAKFGASIPLGCENTAEENTGDPVVSAFALNEIRFGDPITGELTVSAVAVIVCD